MNKEEVYKLLEKHYRENAESLVKRHQRFLQSTHRAEDVVQEAYTRAFTYWRTFPTDGNHNRWFGMILLNCLKDNQRAEHMSGMSDSALLEELPTSSNAFPRIAYKEAVRFIMAEPQEIRTILELSLLHQYASKEIAQLVPETADNIRKIVQRFRERLKEEFKHAHHSGSPA